MYIKKVQSQIYGHIKECVDQEQILLLVDYEESCKKVQQNETQSVQFEKSTFSIFTACCYTKSLDDIKGLRKDYIIVVSESIGYNKTTALTCLKKVIEETEKKILHNTARSRSGLTAQFQSRLVFDLFTENFFHGVQLSWYYNEKSHGKGPINEVGGTVKNVIFRKEKLSFLTIHKPSEFHQVVLKYVPTTKSILLKIFEEPKNKDREVKPIVETL